MFSTSSSSSWKLALVTVLSTLQLATAHFQIQYPSWRGNTLKDDMQWNYPCAGVSTTNNRTNWPITGGDISIVPGWNAGHPTAFFYVNMGFGSTPPNMTNVMLPVFQMTGPSKNPYPGSFCLTQVPLPVNASVKVGDNATIQVIQVALHGASLYNCADITFVEPENADPMPEGMCQNSSTIGFNMVYTTHSGAMASSLIDKSTMLTVVVGGLVLGWFL
ncbi:hypothetical protein DFP73DRAFT_551571 [Morchella snyderi]|nr:hypothetical protein DFP73DRAFT_551571 [Morchella snyderi]